MTGVTTVGRLRQRQKWCSHTEQKSERQYFLVSCRRQVQRVSIRACPITTQIHVPSLCRWGPLRSGSCWTAITRHICPTVWAVSSYDRSFDLTDFIPWRFRLPLRTNRCLQHRREPSTPGVARHTTLAHNVVRDESGARQSHQCLGPDTSQNVNSTRWAASHADNGCWVVCMWLSPLSTRRVVARGCTALSQGVDPPCQQSKFSKDKSRLIRR